MALFGFAAPCRDATRCGRQRQAGVRAFLLFHHGSGCFVQKHCRRGGGDIIVRLRIYCSFLLTAVSLPYIAFARPVWFCLARWRCTSPSHHNPTLVVWTGWPLPRTFLTHLPCRPPTSQALALWPLCYVPCPMEHGGYMLSLCVPATPFSPPTYIPSAGLTHLPPCLPPLSLWVPLFSTAPCLPCWPYKCIVWTGMAWPRCLAV